MSTAVILAAGYGSRMCSAVPKALHPIAGRPMLAHLLESCAAVFDHVVVVVGPGMDRLAAVAAPHAVVVQHDRLGTAHAALQAAPLFGDGEIAVLYADNPLITPATLARLLQARVGADMALLAMRPPVPGRYGRVIVQDGYVARIVEHADAGPEDRAVDLCNAGVFCGGADAMRTALSSIQPSPGGEYYLTDLVPLMGRTVAVEAPYAELQGINTRAELAAAEAVVQHRLRHEAMAAGVTMTAPETVFLAHDTRLARDVSVGPHVVFGPGVIVAEGADIRAFSHLEGCSVGTRTVIGPYARLRPGTMLDDGAQVGNFVELKATHLGAGAKASHLSYLGDATVGIATNVGAGTITCNYDGIGKHRTSIGAGVFVGSAATLVAPLTIGDGAFVAAGSTITEDVAPDALAFGRARQISKPGSASRLRAWLQARRERG